MNKVIILVGWSTDRALSRYPYKVYPKYFTDMKKANMVKRQLNENSKLYNYSCQTVSEV